MAAGFGRVMVTMLLSVAFVVRPPNVQAVPRVLFTVDVESIETSPLPKQVEAVCQNGSACGLMEIVRMLAERRMAGTFFLNVYEYRSWGEPELRDIAVKLQSAGQDVALHTHPQWAYDPARPGMYEYNLEDQTSIIREGVQFLTAWTGRPVVAHRAGDYAADDSTLKALERNGLRVDSSLFWGNPRCRLKGAGLARNLPSLVGRITEIPVTIYRREERPELFGDTLRPITSIRKIDVDWFLDADEARAAVDAVVEANLPFLVVFLHSFSFLAAQGDGGVPVVDMHARDIFRAILERVSEKRLTVVTMRDLAESEAVVATSQDQDILPRVTVHVGLHRYLWHRLRAAGPRDLTGAALLAVMLFTVGTGVVAARRWRRLKENTLDGGR